MTTSLTMMEFHNLLMDTYDQRPDPLTYAMLGLAGETGEVIEKYKKLMRLTEPELVYTMEESEEILAELGDVLWYVARIAKALNSDLEYVAQINIRKLRERSDRGRK